MPRPEPTHDDHSRGGPHHGAPRRSRAEGFFGPEFAAVMGRMPFGRGGGPWGSGQRAPRGNARAAALALLAEQPRNGYQLMQEIEGRSNGVWRPSPGSMYPILQQLADEGMIEQSDGGKTWSITAEGRAYVESHADETKAPWDLSDDLDSGVMSMRQAIAGVMKAAMQVAAAGTPAQVDAAQTLLVATRKKLYLILAEDEAPEE